MLRHQRDIHRNVSLDRKGFEQWSSTRGYFGPRRYLAMSGDNFVCVYVWYNWGLLLVSNR